jgi:hypothetical protein
MASPYVINTLAASLLTSKDVEVLSEKIVVNINKDFSIARYNITYYLKSEITGKDIPLLFYAKSVTDTFFSVSVDGKPLKIFDSIPQAYYQRFNFDTDTVSIHWGMHSELCPLSELKFFELPVTNQQHRVEVQYYSYVSENSSNWIKEYFFTYSLSPARHWKSFGKLEIIINQEQFRPIATNLGTPGEQNIGLVNSWVFDTLPADYFIISYTPPMSMLAKVLIQLHPINLTLTAQLMFFGFFLFKAIRFRKKHPQIKRNKWNLPGAILTAFFFPFGLWLMYELTELALGPHKGQSPFYGIGALGVSYIVYGIFLAVGVGVFTVLKITDTYLKKSIKQQTIRYEKV